MASACPVCWGRGLPPYEHNLKKGRIPRVKEELEEGILASGSGLYDKTQLDRMLVTELRHAWQRAYNTIPHPENPCVSLNFCFGKSALIIAGSLYCGSLLSFCSFRKRKGSISRSLCSSFAGIAVASSNNNWMMFCLFEASQVLQHHRQSSPAETM